MCGRFTNRMTWREIATLYDITDDGFRPNLAPRYNIAPTQMVPAVRTADGGRVLRLMRWGWERGWSKRTLINAAMETIATSPAFAPALAVRRCLVPADGFYEWTSEDGARQPWRIVLEDEQPFAMAGLWEVWTADRDGVDVAAGETVEAFTIVTTRAAPAMRALHARMPAILPPALWTPWLDGSAGTEALVPYAGGLHAYRVSRAVNNVRNDSPDLVAAL